MLKLVILVLLAMATSSYGDKMDERDIDTFCVEKNLQDSYDVNHAINNCFKDPSDVRLKDDPRNHPEKLKKELQKINEKYMFTVSKRHSDVGTDQDENSQLTRENVDLNDNDELNDPREADEDENGERFDDMTTSDPVAWGSRRRGSSWSSRRRSSWSSRRRSSWSSRRRSSWSSRRRVVWRRRTRRRIVWRRRTRRRIVWRRRTRRRIVWRRRTRRRGGWRRRTRRRILRRRRTRRRISMRRRTSSTRRRTWRRRSYGRPGNPRVDGCSIPGGLPFFFKRAFRRVCNKHDVCYYRVAAAKNGEQRQQLKESLSQATCDNIFYRDMLNRCKSYGFLKRAGCRITAGVYYRAVRLFGRSHYG